MIPVNNIPVDAITIKLNEPLPGGETHMVVWQLEVLKPGVFIGVAIHDPNGDQSSMDAVDELMQMLNSRVRRPKVKRRERTVKTDEPTTTE